MAYHRTQLLLEPWQHKQLKALAEDRGISQSELLRMLVSEGLERHPPKKRGVLDLVGIVEDGTWEEKDIDRTIYEPDW